MLRMSIEQQEQFEGAGPFGDDIGSAFIRKKLFLSKLFKIQIYDWYYDVPDSKNFILIWYIGHTDIVEISILNSCVIDQILELYAE